MRYFKNPYKDYANGESTTLHYDFWSKFVMQKMNEISRNVPCDPITADGALYTGSPGIGYAFWYLAKTASDVMLTQHKRSELREQGLKYCESYFLMRKVHDPDTSFLCGAAGVHVTAALLAHDLGRADLCQQHILAFQAIGPKLQPVSFFQYGSDEMLVGRAGYLAGALHLSRFVPNSLDHKTIAKLYESIITSGMNYSAHRRSPTPLMYAYYDTEYLGAAHGLSGILQKLLSAHGAVQGVQEPKEVRQAVDFLLSLKQTDGNYPPSLDEVTQARRKCDALIHWCHGASGVVYCLAIAYRRYGNSAYLKAIYEASDLVWERGLLTKGPGICHGIAGSGYVHLLCHRLADSPEMKQKYLYRAVKCCEFLASDEFQRHSQTPDHPWSLFEGWAGTLVFISDLLSNPDEAEFPFSDAFSF